MKKKQIIEIIFIILAISLISYPIISNYIYSHNQKEDISNYKKEMDDLSDEDKKRELERAKKYNDDIEKDADIDISLEEKETKNNSKYTSILNLKDAMGYISIPKIKVYLPIYHGTSKKVLQSGVGHIENSSLPIGGKNTHAVLAGHTGLAKKKIFDDINKLKIGDEFYIYILNETLTYKVDKIDIVSPDNSDVIKTEENKDYITLVTCTPRLVNTHRLLVRGERMEY